MSAFLNAAKLPGIWTNYDYLNAALISAVPISVGLAELGSAAEGGHYRKFFEVSFITINSIIINLYLIYSAQLDQNGQVKILLFMLEHVF